VPFFYVRYYVLPSCKQEKEVWEVEEPQAPLQADKATLASEAAEDLPAIETRQHHGEEA
jgi:hypothetical protein